MAVGSCAAAGTPVAVPTPLPGNPALLSGDATHVPRHDAPPPVPGPTSTACKDNEGWNV
eukprot:gene7674-7148_t